MRNWVGVAPPQAMQAVPELEDDRDEEEELESEDDELTDDDEDELTDEDDSELDDDELMDELEDDEIELDDEDEIDELDDDEDELEDMLLDDDDELDETDDDDDEDDETDELDELTSSAPSPGHAVLNGFMMNCMAEPLQRFPPKSSVRSFHSEQSLSAFGVAFTSVKFVNTLLAGMLPCLTNMRGPTIGVHSTPNSTNPLHRLESMSMDQRQGPLAKCASPTTGVLLSRIIHVPFRELQAHGGLAPR